MEEKMSDSSKKTVNNNDGLSRRDLLKIMGAGALYSMLPAYGANASVPEFGMSKGRGVIFVVGDGMPLGVIRAMHELSTRSLGNARTNFYSRMMDPGSTIGHAGTRSLSSIVTDSAPGAVAWTTGSKTANRLLSSLPDGRPLKTIMELVKENGYACGLVSTARITHATPAAWVSHQMHRDLEDNVALDILKFKPDVALGGGSVHFDPSKREDKRDLFREFAEAGYDVAKDRDTLLSPAVVSSKKPLLGVFNKSHISYYVDRLNDTELGKRQPSLAEMTTAALQRLSSAPKGFLLHVEAGRIDHANHSNDAWGAIMDTYELDMTLGVIETFLKTNPETLVIVTSDHGNSGWGINGTGPEYNDSTDALKKYLPIKASFEVINKKIKGKNRDEIRDIFEHYTTYPITADEAAMIHEAMQPSYKAYPRDFTLQPDAVMGKILAHSIYAQDAAGHNSLVLRRGNVGFTSCHHTAEDQIVLAYGYKARELGIERYFENTYLFDVMCRFFGVTHKNPSMTEEEAKQYIKVASAEEWERHMKLHIA